MISKHVNYRFYRIIVLALALMLFIPAISIAAEVTLAWDPNPVLENVDSYTVYCGYSSGNYEINFNVGNQTTYTISGLESGQKYYFAVSAYNTDGRESPFSKEIVYYVPPSTLDSPSTIDTDGDGLTDDEEINIYGTDPKNADTDEDGITDGEEITFYGTNPNDPDTDGDGINDGNEVKFWGYDWDMDFDNDGIINLIMTVSSIF